MLNHTLPGHRTKRQISNGTFMNMTLNGLVVNEYTLSQKLKSLCIASCHIRILYFITSPILFNIYMDELDTQTRGE